MATSTNPSTSVEEEIGNGNAIFREPDTTDNHFLPDFSQPYLPPYPNPSRLPTVFHNSSNSTPFETLFYFTPTVSNILILICLTSCTIWVLVMNMLIIGALWKGHAREKDHVTAMYLMNLAFADVLLGIFVFPFMSMVILIGYFPLSSTWCNIWVYFDYYLIIATSFGFAALMCSYLCMVRWPEYYPRSNTFHFGVIVIVWILSNAPWSAPFFHDRVSFVYPDGICGFSIQKNRYFTFYIGFTGLYIPLAISLIAGIFAAKHLKEISPRTPFFNLLLKSGSSHVYPCVPAPVSNSQLNDLDNGRREYGRNDGHYVVRPHQVLSPSDMQSESTDRSDSSIHRKRHSLISISTFQRNKPLQDSVRRHFPLVATSLILFVICRSLFYTYFGVGSFVPRLFPPDLSHNVYWLMHGYAVLAPVVHLVLDEDVRRSVIRFVTEGTFQLPLNPGKATDDELGNQQHHVERVLPPVSVIDYGCQQNRRDEPVHEVGRLDKHCHYV